MVIYKYFRYGSLGISIFETLEQAMKEAFIENKLHLADCYEIIADEKSYTKDDILQYWIENNLK